MFPERLTALFLMSNFIFIFVVCVVCIWYNNSRRTRIMKLYYDRRLKDPTYYAQVGFRDTNGKATTKNVKRLGKHSELLKITDDPLSYAKEQIKILNKDTEKHSKLSVLIDFNQSLAPSNDIVSQSLLKNIGYFYLQALYQKLHISSFIKKITSDSKVTFDCDSINAFLTFSRMIDPGSKLKFTHSIHQYFDAPTIDHQHVLRFMDILYDHFFEYVEWLYKKSNNVIPRKSSVLYYDCTNFFTEIDSGDEDYEDPVTGEIITGLRQFGISKEHRTTPIVELGLFIDQDGLPVSLCIHPGNRNEQLTAIPLESEILNMTDGKPFIYCADGGLGSYNIRKFNSMGGRAFIITQSIKKLSSVLKESVFNDCDYRLLSDEKTPISLETMKTFDYSNPDNLHLYRDKAYKVVSANKTVDTGLYELEELKNGKVRKRKVKGTLHQKIIITFDRQLYEYQRNIRNRQIKRAKKLLDITDPEDIKKGPNDIKRFLKRISKDSNGEDVEVTYQLDTEKIAEEEMYDGFYAIATNVEGSAKDIISVIKNRYKIEESFRILKTNFDGRPFYHSDQKRIQTHFLICFAALLIYRLLETLIDRKGTHLTTTQIIETLKNMNVTDINKAFYSATYSDSQALQILEELFELNLAKQNYKPSDLKKKIKKLRR